ncbi:hypothetical protein EDC94DRAFT_585734 [Helicostylum pulchrum]|nr:hypothetical protein EDC94DRAFT_585734 [Helicostylum pulchrum]
MHLFKEYLFKSQNVALYSEQVFIAKLWCCVFEEVFNNTGLCLHWGDTTPTKLKKDKNVDMKIDLRILFCLNTKKPDVCVDEFSKKVISRKLYVDKLKEVMVSKYHLNELLLSALPSSSTLIPFIQIMGFSCRLYVLRQVEDFYVLEIIDTIIFPITLASTKDNSPYKKDVEDEDDEDKDNEDKDNEDEDEDEEEQEDYDEDDEDDDEEDNEDDDPEEDNDKIEELYEK